MRLLRYLGYLVYGVLGVGILAIVMIVRPFYTPECTTRIVDNQRALLASDKELAGLDTGNRPAMCQVYRQRVSVLRQTVPISMACGSVPPAPEGTVPPMHVELSFYENLVAQKCDAI